jgi:hypothetical protein
LSIDQAKEREKADGNVVQRKKIIKASRGAKKRDKLEEEEERNSYIRDIY